MQNISHSIPGKTATFRDLACRYVTIFFAQFPHKLRRILLRVNLSFIPRFMVASLDRHIFHILLVGTNPKVIRVAAKTIVTAMTNLVAFGNSSLREFVNKTMNQLIFTAYSHKAIAVAGSLPVPALRRGTFFDVAPEALLQCSNPPTRLCASDSVTGKLCVRSHTMFVT